MQGCNEELDVIVMIFGGYIGHASATAFIVDLLSWCDYFMLIAVVITFLTVSYLYCPEVNVDRTN